MADNLAHPDNRHRVLTIDDLPDDDLLAIFDFSVDRELVDLLKGVFGNQDEIQSWQSLVHVCRRWRGLVFDSPRRLNLQLFCTTSTPARTLDVWPVLPLLIQGMVLETSVDNVIAVLEHSDHIRQIDLTCSSISHFENFWTAMEVPFPELALLRLTHRFFGPVLPDSFLGGSAPRLRFLALSSIAFPGLPKLLLSATHLVELYLHDIPHSVYILPEAMVTCLSTLTSLETLDFHFRFPQFYPDQESRRPRPKTRSVLPALTKFLFRGVKEYSEDLVSRIDAPRLYRLLITFFPDINFDNPELNQFISRTPTLGPYNETRLIFGSQAAGVRLRSHPWPSDHGMVEVKILCEAPDRQLSSLEQICTSSLRHLLTMENLYIDGYPFIILYGWPDDIEETGWLDLLLPFTAVKNLYVSKELSPRIAPTLQELTGGRITEVLPALQNVLLEGFQPSEPVQEGIAQFVAARQLSGHPVAVSLWERDSDPDKDGDYKSMNDP